MFCFTPGAESHYDSVKRQYDILIIGTTTPPYSNKNKWHINTIHINTKHAVVYQIRISVITCFTIVGNRIGGVMVSVLVSSAVDRGFWWCNG